MSHLPPIPVLVGGVLAAATLGVVALSSAPADGTPLYAQRSGRTCGNCHVSPTLQDPEGWDNPSLMERKCTMSCISCHTNPTGGGLRNASGRYYGQSTLAMFHTQERSYSDNDRELVSNDALWRFEQRHGREVNADDGDPTDERTSPSDWAAVEAGMGAGQTGNWTAIGNPLGKTSKMSFWDGRYDDLNADPLLQFGLDARGAWWSGTDSGFPMQVDGHVSLQPVEHVTFMTTAALRGRSSGVLAIGEDKRAPVYARTAIVTIHELPGMSWAKVGRFLPAYGQHIDDHTSFTRALFEMDMSDDIDLVHGVEIGTAPNYPWGTASVFTNNIGNGRDEGWGGTVAGGWRDLGWSLGAHAMMKNRGGMGRGDLLAAGVQWGFNPIYYNNKIPITVVGEVSYGQRTTDATQRFAASTTEAWWLLKNGLNLRIKHDFALTDLSIQGEWQQRWALGWEVAPIPGLTFTAWGRALQRPGTGARPDLFLTTHIWF